MTRKVKDAGPDSNRKMPKFDGSEDDVEGHSRRMGKDEVGPDGNRKMPKFDGSDDDSVEGHRK